jgi:2-oxoglutarate dehydrogenase E1 component
VNCTTPANFFHVLRRQMLRDFRKPLIVFSPKSLLRHPHCVSPVEDLISGHFCEVIDDTTADPKKVKRVVLCQGKVYYDLLAKKEEIGDDSVALIRLEQIEPLPKAQLLSLYKKYGVKCWTWVQEEPANMGAWGHLLRVFPELPMEVISREPSGTPATGSAQRHAMVHRNLIEKVFNKALVQG